MVLELFMATALSFLPGLVLIGGYISNNAFPQPLSKENEAIYLRRLEEGNEEARNILIEHNLRLVAHIIKKFDSIGDDPDDLISIGTIGLIKAINTFKIDKGTKLATYAARCIENEILMFLRASKKARTEVFLHDPIGTDKEGNEITLIDILGTDPDSVSELVEKFFESRRLLEKIKKLKSRERRVLELRYGLGGGPRKTQREIAHLFGISRSYVSRIEKKAIKKLFQELSQNNQSS